MRASALAAGYALGALFLHLRSARGRRLGAGDVLPAALAGFGLVFIAFLAADLQMSRITLMLMFGWGVGTLVTGFLVSRFRGVLLGGLAVVVLSMIVWSATSGTPLTTSGPKARVTSEITTSLYAMRATFNRNYIPRSASHYTGGGITPWGPGHLIATGDGNLLAVTWTSDGAPEVQRLSGRVPMNRDEFAATAGSGSYISWFRVLDVLARENGGKVQILVSHHRWKDAERCFVVRVSMLEGDQATPLEQLSRGSWRTIHDTEPCLPLVTSEPAWPFRGMEGGGRMAFIDDDHLLLTVGDHGFNGVDFENEPNRVPEATSSYGKTVIVDVRDGSWGPYSIGHRNPQGLVVDSVGTVWLTEHGPQGGDELNRLERGTNYGWPEVTHGTDYGKYTWPRNPRQGHHDGYAKPVYSWAPSIGASNLIVVRSPLFEAWEGDLLIGSLVGQTLLRVRVDGDRVRLIEPIPMGVRIRDLVQDARGRIVLLTDNYSIVTLEPSQTPFALCAGCHTTTAGAQATLGPNLAGVVGREIASSSGFGYSEALRSVGGIWTEERLHRFLADPQEFAPGTSMVIEGIKDSLVRGRIIDYLKSR
jgi:cytochrome c2